MTYGSRCQSSSAIHLHREENWVADWLSRWEIGDGYRKKFSEFISGESELYKKLVVRSDMFSLTDIQSITP